MKNTIKKILLIFTLAVLISICAVSVNALEYTDKCGENVYWNFDSETGILTISGEGDTFDYLHDTHASYRYMGLSESITDLVIENGVTNIGNYLFDHLCNLKSIKFSESVTSIGDLAFWGCESLTNITIPGNVTSIGNSAFSGCKNLINITISNGVSSIGECAFGDCESLESISIPSSVTNIGDGFSCGCTKLSTIIVDKNNPNYLNDEYGVLFDKNKTNLVAYPIGNIRSTYIIPDNVKSVKSYAFYGCESLEHITFPDSIESIGTWAFGNCESFIHITLPDSIENIGGGAFTNTGYFNDDKNWVNGVLYIDNHLVRARDSIITCEIKPETKTIADEAFYSCENLANITIPNSVLNIGNFAFVYCDSLKNIAIPDSVKNIGEYAFNGCDSLSEITVYNNKYYSNDEYGVLFDKNKTRLIVYPSGNTRKSYDIPNSVKYIDDYAFNGSENLRSVTIPDSVTSIGIRAFAWCEKLNNITIPYGVSSIGEEAFYDCMSLYSLTIPDSVTSIGSGAFTWCENLNNITLSNGLTSIDDMVFSECRRLKHIIIPDSVVSIGDWAFTDCESLQDIVIPDSVVSIGEYAFWGCDKLEDVYYKGSESQWNEIKIKYRNEELLEANIHYYYNHPHQYITVSVTPATHLKEGEEILTCICGSTYTRFIPKLEGHTYTVTQIIAPSCTSQGYTTYTCECGYSYDGDYVNANGHVDRDDDCYCDICGFKVREKTVWEKIKEWFEEFFDRLFGWMKRK